MLDKGKPKAFEREISFSKKDATNIHLHNDDRLVIIGTYVGCEIRRVLVDQGSSAYILYRDAYERLCLNPDDLNPLKGSLVGFCGEQVQVKDYITLRTTFETHELMKEIKVRYLVIDAPSSYNMIIECLTFNQLGIIVSTLYLCMKYLLSDERVRVIQEDQTIVWKCYIESLKLKKGKDPCHEHHEAWFGNKTSRRNSYMRRDSHQISEEIED